MSVLVANVARWQKSCGCLLTFHRAAPASAWADLPNRNFYLNLEYLDSLLEHLVRHNWKIVTIEELLDKLSWGEADARLVNFSVDDCYKDTWEYVVPAFRRHRVPVTLFVTTGIPDGTQSLGWAGLESILSRHSHIVYSGETVDVRNPAAKRHWFAEISAAWDKSDFDREYDAFCRVNGADPETLRSGHALTWGMLDSFRNDPLVEIGSHTVSHPRISALSQADALSELRDSRERLRSRLGVACNHFAFPYGRAADCGPRDFSLAREAGFASAATTRKGLIQPGQHVFCLPRNTLNGAYQSIAYVNSLLSGLAGSAAKVMGRV